MVDSKGPDKEEVLNEQEAELVEESSAVYLLDEPQVSGKYWNKQEDLKLTSSAQLAATSQEGENNLPQRYFEKYLDQRMANIDEKFLSIKEDNNLIRQELRISVAEIQRSITQNISEMRERDNQRHAELIAVNARFDRFEARMSKQYNQLETKLDARFDNLDLKYDRLEAKMEEKYNRLEAKMDARFGNLEAKYDRLEEKYDGLNDKMDNNHKWIIGLAISSLLAIVGVLVQIFLTLLK